TPGRTRTRGCWPWAPTACSSSPSPSTSWRESCAGWPAVETKGAAECPSPGRPRPGSLPTCSPGGSVPATASAIPASAAVTAAAAPPAAVTAPPAAAAALLGPGLVDGQRPPVDLLAAEGGDGGLGLLVGAHLHEAEALGAARVAVHDHLRGHHGPVRLEQPA